MKRPTLTNNGYWKKSADELRFIVKDAGEAARVMRDHDNAAESKYLEQVCDACTVLNHRNGE